MRIDKGDMHPRLDMVYAARVREFDMRAASMTVEPGDAYEVHRQYEAMQKTDGIAVAATFAMILLGVFGVIGSIIALASAYLLLGVCLLGGAIGLSVVFVRWLNRRIEKGRYRARNIRLVLPLVAAQEAEKQYARALLELMRDDCTLGESASRELLGHLNALLESGYEIADQRERIGSAAIESNRLELEATREDLTARIAAATDAETRAILQQSLAICEARLERARALSPLQGRLEAQQEMIHQTLASVAEALASLKLAPSTVTPPLAAIHDTVERIQGQTKAVEQAVREVMALRAGG